MNLILVFQNLFLLNKKYMLVYFSLKIKILSKFDAKQKITLLYFNKCYLGRILQNSF